MTLPSTGVKGPRHDPARITAGLAGKLTYQGAPCVGCGSRVRGVDKADCVACTREKMRRRDKQRRVG